MITLQAMRARIHRAQLEMRAECAELISQAEAAIESGDPATARERLDRVATIQASRLFGKVSA